MVKPSFELRWKIGIKYVSEMAPWISKHNLAIMTDRLLECFHGPLFFEGGLDLGYEEGRVSYAHNSCSIIALYTNHADTRLCLTETGNRWFNINSCVCYNLIYLQNKNLKIIMCGFPMSKYEAN